MYDKAAVAMYKDGMKVSQISNLLNFHYTTVYGWLRKHNITLRSCPNWSKHRKLVSAYNKAVFKAAKQSGEL